VDLLLRFDDPEVALEVVSRLLRGSAHALLIVDQFDELFTQNAHDEQLRFADLLNRFVLETDVHVLFSMRDDFLFRCHEVESLKPIFFELTPIGPPVGGALRRALVRPATKCGYRFEDDELVEEMLAEVEGERGALPLVAFALARLWEKRDRETGFLTRQAYQDIGGVGGALARHAEATMDRIGTERIAVVRELFRNLVTAEGTRAVREWDELLSVFGPGDVSREGINPSPTAAEEVLRELIDARLLTSYEVKEEDREPARRVEIIHESLLANWPRLVRWQTQDADAARVRDQLRQAARTWHEHGRTDDMLWTGSAYREFAVWRESYPGGLTETEEAFAAAMTSLATRRRRRRRMAAASALVLAVAVASVFGVLWRRSVLETRRAEAAKLLAIGQAELDIDPTEALAYATSSLELADTYEARIFATRALWAGPPVRALDLQRFSGASFQSNTFSPDGRWLAVSPIVSEDVLVFNEHGGDPIILGGHGVSVAGGQVRCYWTRDGLLVTGNLTEGRVRIWSMPEGQLVREIELGGNAYWVVGDLHLLARIVENEGASGQMNMRLRSWRLPDGEPEELGVVHSWGMLDRDGKSWIYAKDEGVYSCPLPVNEGVPDTLIARHSSEEAAVYHWARPQGIMSADSGGEIILWTSPDGTSVSGRRLHKPETATTRLFSDASGRWAYSISDDIRLDLWDRAGMTGANPWAFRRRGAWILSAVDFHPSGALVVATTRNRSELSFWPLTAPLPFVAEGWQVFEITGDGHFLLVADRGTKGGNWANEARLWPLPGTEPGD